MPSIRHLRPRKTVEPPSAPRVLDYYQILGVERTAPDTEITQAFRRLVAQCDVDPSYSPSATPQRHLATLSAAYAVLVDPAKRQRYDRQLEERQRREAEGSRQEAEGSRQTAGGSRQEAGGGPQGEAVASVPLVPSVPFVPSEQPAGARSQAATARRPARGVRRMAEGPRAAKVDRLGTTRLLSRQATTLTAKPGPDRVPLRHPDSSLRQKAVEAAKHSVWWGLSLLIHACAIWIMANWNIQMAAVERVVPGGKMDTGIVDEVKVTLPPLPPDTGVPGGPLGPDPPVEVFQPAPIMLDREVKAELAKVKQSAIIGVEMEGPYSGRYVRSRGIAGGRRGGGPGGPGGPGTTEVSESSVEAGLRWLASKQLSIGSWKADREEARWADPGLTGLALLAFQGAGYTHTKGQYQDIVRRGLAYLKDVQDGEGCIALSAYVDGGAHKRVGGYMYNHGIATLALTEAYGMTKDLRLRERAERAVDFICKTQNSTGGWRYYANSPDADSSVSGWMVMALRSARLAGIEVPQKVFDGARRLFDSVTDKETGATSYMPGLPPSSAALIAVGLLCHQYLGMKSDDPYIDLASAAINKFPPVWLDVPRGEGMALENLPKTNPGANDYYFWYYANLALHQKRSEAWEKWHPQVRDLLTQQQLHDGPHVGSWPPLDRWSLRGGRVYSTCLGILCLKVYYRYSPIYKEVADPVLAAFGEAVTAYNDFVEAVPLKNEATAKARAKAQEALEGFLAKSEPKPNAPPDEPSRKRRGEAAKMLIAIAREAGEHDKAIALLNEIPTRFPGLLSDAERTSVLADCHLVHSRSLAAAGKADEAHREESKAVNIYFAAVKADPKLNPARALWTADRLFERDEWQKARELYESQAALIPKKVDPKTLQGGRAAYVCRQIFYCYNKIGLYSNAAEWLKRYEGIVGPSMALLRERADLERAQKQYPAARTIYETLMKRAAPYSTDWWRAKADQLEMFLLEGQRAHVDAEVGKLELFNPQLGGPQLRPRLLDLRRRAQAGS